jgi:hypothetical protein
MDDREAHGGDTRPTGSEEESDRPTR